MAHLEMYTTIIVEDTKEHAQFLQKTLEKNCLNIKVLAVCATAKKALEEIRRLKPDFVFLDVELGNSSGFDLLQDLSDQRFKVVFVTSFEHYMLQALKASATDFLLKPYTEKQLLDTVALVTAAIDKTPTNSVNQQLQQILDCVQTPFLLKSTLRLRNINGIHLVPVEDIVYCKADSNQTIFHLKGNKDIKVSQLLGEFENMLEPYGLVRIQKSYIINLAEINNYKMRSGDLKMKGYDGKVLSVSPDKKEWFDDLFNGLPTIN